MHHPWRKTPGQFEAHLKRKLVNRIQHDIVSEVTLELLKIVELEVHDAHMCKRTFEPSS
jgi:hypothetical protein